MSLAEVILKSEEILKKYERFDPQNMKPARQKTEDPFMDMYFEVMDRVQDLNLRLEQLGTEKNRAKRAQLNADLRREKQTLYDHDLPMLAKLIKTKFSTPEIEAERIERFDEVRKAVDEIPDGMTANGATAPQRAFSSPVRNVGEVTINPANMQAQLSSPALYQHTEETSEFAREFAASKDRQDVHLDNIERGLSTLKDIGSAMQEELDRHDVVIDDVSRKMDNVTRELANNNARLKGLVTSMGDKSTDSRSPSSRPLNGTTPRARPIMDLDMDGTLGIDEQDSQTDWLRVIRLLLLFLAGCAAAITALAGLSTLGYLTVTRAFTPSQTYYSRELPLDIVGSDLIADASLIPSHMTKTGKFLDPGQIVELWVDLRLPYGCSSGMAHLTADLLDAEGNVLFKGSKPVFLRSQRFSVKRFITLPFRWSGLLGDAQHVPVRLISNYKEVPTSPLTTFRLSIKSRTPGFTPEILGVEVQVRLQLSIVRQMLYMIRPGRLPMLFLGAAAVTAALGGSLASVGLFFTLALAVWGGGGSNNGLLGGGGGGGVKQGGSATSSDFANDLLPGDEEIDEGLDQLLEGESTMSESSMPTPRDLLESPRPASEQGDKQGSPWDGGIRRRFWGAAAS